MSVQLTWKIALLTRSLFTRKDCQWGGHRGVRNNLPSRNHAKPSRKRDDWNCGRSGKGGWSWWSWKGNLSACEDWKSWKRKDWNGGRSRKGGWSWKSNLPACKNRKSWRRGNGRRRRRCWKGRNLPASNNKTIFTGNDRDGRSVRADDRVELPNIITGNEDRNYAGTGEERESQKRDTSEHGEVRLISCTIVRA